MDNKIIISTSGFIKDLKSLLDKDNSYDAELVEILKSNILLENPSPNSVHEALEKIKDLAKTRVKEVNDGISDNN